MEQQFLELDKSWRDLKFDFVDYVDQQSNTSYLLSKIDELYQVIDELLANFNNILGSKYMSLLRSKAEAV